MNTIIISNENGLVSDHKTLEHIHTVLKSKVGDILRIGILNQDIYSGEILSLSHFSCQLKLSKIEPATLPWFNLIVGLSRPQTMKKVLEHGTTFGAKEFHFFKAELSEKSYLDSKIFSDSAYNEFLLAGLSQSGIYTHLPTLTLEKYNPASQYQTKNQQKFILDLDTDKSFQDFNLKHDLPITLAIGPERGLTPNDLAEFHAAGFQSVKISSSILRVEHAIYAAISQLEMLRNFKQA
jgi:RsmE family RNA methyltransferase